MPYGHRVYDTDREAKRQVGGLLLLHKKQIEENKRKLQLRYDPAKEILFD